MKDKKCGHKCAKKVTKEENKSKCGGHEVLIKYKNAAHRIVPSDCLLEDLKKLGIPVGSGCRVGICGICKIKVKSGEVEYDASPLAYLQEGEVLTCIGKIKSDLEIENI